VNIPTEALYPIAIILAYLLGSIPVGLIVVRALTGQDVREVGSGRTGGTNAMRAGGLLAFILTGIGDVAKGIGAVNIARLLFPNDPSLVILEALCGIAVVVGHNYSVYIGFRGGAGASPNIGAAAALWPISLLITVPLMPLVLFGVGYASVASTVVALSVLVIFLTRYLAGSSPLAYVGYGAVTTILVGIALIPNYRRLIAGTERLVGPRAKRMQHSSGENNGL